MERAQLESLDLPSQGPDVEDVEFEGYDDEGLSEEGALQKDQKGELPTEAIEQLSLSHEGATEPVSYYSNTPEQVHLTDESPR